VENLLIARVSHRLERLAVVLRAISNKRLGPWSAHKSPAALADHVWSWMFVPQR
jgi:hypothetical protein